MTEQATLIATLAAPPSVEGTELTCLDAGVERLEVRADRVGDPDPDWLRQRFPGQLLYTLRSRDEGGDFDGPPADRAKRLGRAARSYDFVDLEAQRDLEEDLLAEIPAQKRILSWHGPPTGLGELHRRVKEMTRVPAALYKLVPAARRSGEEMAPLELLAELERRDVVAFASGAVGVWTRMVAPHLGAPVVYGASGEVPGAPGQPSISRLRTDYGLPRLPRVERYFGIVGQPVSHSLSPRLHNGAYRALGIPASYLAFHADSFADFWLEVVEGKLFGGRIPALEGLSVTAPCKQSALSVAGASSPLAKQIDSANTLCRGAAGWEAETTDPAGVVGPLTAAGVDLAGVPVVVLGCGGAGRAAAAGLHQAGARVSVANRSVRPGKAVAERLGLPFVLLSELVPEDFSVLVNATSLGHNDDDPLPLEVPRLRPDAVVVDMVYRREPTPLLREVRSTRRRGIDGREVLLHQALGQFRLMTGQELPLDLGRQLLGLEGG